MKKKALLLILLIGNYISIAQILFEDEALLRGVTSQSGYDGNGNGLSFADYNMDGWDDLTLPSGLGQTLTFYKNVGGFFVEDNVLSPSINYNTRSISWSDYDNDGDKDLFIVSDSEGNRLYRQDSGFVFNDVTTSAGLFTDAIETYSVSWGDINNDGCLDLFFSNRTLNPSITNYLFKNNCDGTFSNITISAGISQSPKLTFGASFFDYNNDGLQDLYVINDKNGSNILYKNNGDSTFTDVSISTNTGIVVDAMSVTIDDYNNDGFFDIYITNTPSDIATPTLGSVLLKNINGVSFEDVSVTSGALLDGWCWGSNFFDADNDSDLDLYVSCIYTLPGERQSYGFYENTTLESFIEPNNIGFINNDLQSFGSVIGDIDNDGKADVAVINNGLTIAPNLWKNNTTTTNNYLTVSLEGTVSNKDGIGSKIEISINGNMQYRYIINGEGYISQNSLKEFFGLGTHTIVDYVKVYWLSGTVDTFVNVAANQILNIVEGSTLSTNAFDIHSYKVYPNPVDKILTLEGESEIEMINIYNVQGASLIREYPYTNKFNINMNSLSKGVYFLKINTASGSITKRLIKE